MNNLDRSVVFHGGDEPQGVVAKMEFVKRRRRISHDNGFGMGHSKSSEQMGRSQTRGRTVRECVVEWSEVDNDAGLLGGLDPTTDQETGSRSKTGLASAFFDGGAFPPAELLVVQCEFFVSVALAETHPEERTLNASTELGDAAVRLINTSSGLGHPDFKKVRLTGVVLGFGGQKLTKANRVGRASDERRPACSDQAIENW